MVFLFLLLTIPVVFAKTIKVGVIEYPPHVIAIKQDLHGPAVDYLKSMLINHFDDIVFIYLPTKRGTIELNKGSVDLLFPISKTSEIKSYLSTPLFHSVPGLCFNKKDFIPILSSTNKLTNLIVGVPAGVQLPPALTHSNANIKTIEGSDVLSRGIGLLIKNRIDSLYHPSPINIYHYTNPLSSQIACSYFYGYSTGLYVATSPLMTKEDRLQLNDIYNNSLKRVTYEFYFAQKANKK